MLPQFPLQNLNKKKVFPIEAAQAEKATGAARPGPGLGH